MVVASKSHRDAATDDYIGKYAVRDMKSAGSSLKFCLVATGEADLYPRLGRTMEWDTAAGDAVLRGAGGHVVRFDDHTPLAYGKAGWDNPFFIAYAPGVELESMSVLIAIPARYAIDPLSGQTLGQPARAGWGKDPDPAVMGGGDGGARRGPGGCGDG